MDLGAYAQITDLNALMASNGIEVPRLRGLRLMSQEKPMSADEIREDVRERLIAHAEHELTRVASNMYEYSDRTKRLKKKYLVYDYVPWEWDGKTGTSLEPVAIRWDQLHGKRRKAMKYALRKYKKEIEKQWEAWNRYAGRRHILYIHARVGAKNWDWYGCDALKKQPWFLEVVDDAFDCTYCDIYAYIREDV